MSHFTVLVVADNEDDLTAKLLPFHEYECTGIEEYTQLVELGKEWLDDYRKDDGTLDEEQLAEYYTEQDGKWYKRTNPNKQWDWWVIGGRWTGFLPLKRNGADNSGNGTPGLMTARNTDEKLADYAMSSDIDWDKMFDDELESESKRHLAYQQALNSKELEKVKSEMLSLAFERWGKNGWKNTWAKSPQDVAEAWAIDEIASKILGRESIFGAFDFEEHPKYRVDRKTFLDSLQVPARTYAFIDLDGNWQQRGKMGWWGCDDKSQGTDDYDKRFWEFIKSIPQGKTVYIIDCHI